VCHCPKIDSNFNRWCIGALASSVAALCFKEWSGQTKDYTQLVFAASLTHATLRRKMKTTRTVKVNNSTNINNTNINKTNNHLKSLNIEKPTPDDFGNPHTGLGQAQNAGYPVSGIPNWLLWNRNHASEWSNRCTIGLMFKSSSTLKIQLNVSVLDKAGIVISSKWNSKQITHSFNLWFSEFCMRHPYKTWCEF